MAESRLYRITGRVQGVFFRDSTRQVARSLGIQGYAINLDDGSVEVLACGETTALDELAAWLADGPPMARVTSVHRESIDIDEPEGFIVG